MANFQSQRTAVLVARLHLSTSVGENVRPGRQIQTGIDVSSRQPVPSEAASAHNLWRSLDQENSYSYMVPYIGGCLWSSSSEIYTPSLGRSSDHCCG